MRLTKGLVLPGVCGLMLMTGTAMALADATVEVKGVHLCCGACVKGVGTALKGVQGVEAKCDRDNSAITIKAKDADAARAALDALGAHGYFGATGQNDLAIKATTAPKGKVKSLTLTGVHNCCGACTKAIKKAIKSVNGVQADTAKAKATTIEITGDFEPEAVLKALNAAGFNATIK